MALSIKKIAIGFAIFISLVGLGVGIYFLVRYFKNQGKPKTIDPEPEPEPEPEQPAQPAQSSSASQNQSNQSNQSNQNDQSSAKLAEYQKYFMMELDLFKAAEKLRLSKTHGVRKNKLSKSHRKTLDKDNRDAYKANVQLLRDDYINKVQKLNISSDSKDEAIKNYKQWANDNLTAMNIDVGKTESFDDSDKVTLAEYQTYFLRQLDLFKKAEKARLDKTHSLRKNKISKSHRKTLDKNNRDAYKQNVESLRDSYINKIQKIDFDEKDDTIKNYKKWTNDNLSAMNINVPKESFTNNIKELSKEDDFLGYYSFEYLGLKNPNYWNDPYIPNAYDNELAKNWHRFNDNCVM